MLRSAALLLLALLGLVAGHARLQDPAGRSAAWRYGFSTPKNVNDNQLNCGGAGNQWGAMGGKCGLCGDPYQMERPRPNEHGGKYGIGVITKTYTQGEWINIGLDVTANHKGWNEIKVCSLDNGPESEECFDQNLLEVEGGGVRWYMPGGINKVFNYRVKLPDSLTCNHCVLQWKWHCGNNWGVDKVTGKGCVGCGPQEEFWSCADVSIKADESVQIKPLTSRLTTKLATKAPTTLPPATKPPTTKAPTTSTTTTTTTSTTTTSATISMTTSRTTSATTSMTTSRTTSATTSSTTSRTTSSTTTTTTTRAPTTSSTTATTTTTTRAPTTSSTTTTTTRAPSMTTSTTTRRTTSTTTTTARPITARPTFAPVTTQPPRQWSPTYAPVTREPPQRGCWATGMYARLPNSASYDYWCRTNCPRNHCPPAVCRCT